MGKKSRWFRKIKIALNLNGNQQLVTGKRIQLINSLDGDSTEEFTWLIQGQGNIQIEAGASHTGTDIATINLK